MKDRAAMLVAVLTRMGAALLVFVLMARGLGPESYGLVVTVMAYATLVSLLSDFGFASKTLRDIAAEQRRGGEILNASLNVKVYLTLLAMLVGGVIILLLPVLPDTRFAVIMFGAAVLIGAVGDLAFTAYRAMGRYADEALLTIWTSLVHVGIIGWIALEHGDITLLAGAYLGSRLIYTALALRGAIRLFPGTRFHSQLPRDMLKTAGSAWSWAADNALGYLNVQIDSLLIGALFGLNAAGIYQAGNRFLQAGFAVSVAIAGVNTPRLSFVGIPSRSFSKAEVRMYLEFCAVALLGVVGLTLVGPWLIKYAIGSQFEEAVDLLPAFAAFFAARCIAAAFGVSLVVLNRSFSRVLGQMVGLAVTTIGILGFSTHFGVQSVPWFMFSGALTTMIVYGFGRFYLFSKVSSAQAAG